MGSPIIFILLAIIALGSAVAMISSKNAVHSALFMILNFVTVACLYITLNAPFIAMVQVTVYAGAIMVLFLFVIMLLGGEQLQADKGFNSIQGVVALSGGVALTLIMGYAMNMASDPRLSQPAAKIIDASPQAIGLQLFSNYTFPFEITSILLLVAMIGVVALRVPKKKGVTK